MTQIGTSKGGRRKREGRTPSEARVRVWTSLYGRKNVQGSLKVDFSKKKKKVDFSVIG